MSLFKRTIAVLCVLLCGAAPLPFRISRSAINPTCACWCSATAGVTSTYPRPYGPRYLASRQISPLQILRRRGWGIAQVSADIPARIATYIAAHPGATFHAVLGPLGANDLGAYPGASHKNAAANYASHVASDILAPLAALGVTRFRVSTQPPTGNNYHNLWRVFLNTSYRTGMVGAFPVSVIDLAADWIMGPDTSYADHPPYGNNEYWIDETHQGLLGNQIYAGIASPVIASMQ